MSERKCVELTAVYDDGTVVRLCRDTVDSLLQALMVSASSVSPVPDCVFLVWAQDAGGSVSRPLRRVTVVRGYHDTHETDCILVDDDAVYLSDLLPAGPARGEILLSGNYRGDECDFRIVVEAVPVKGEEP